MHSRQRLPVDRPREQHFPALGLFRGDGTAVGLGRISELGDVGGGERHVHRLGAQPGGGQDVSEADAGPLGGRGGTGTPGILTGDVPHLDEPSPAVACALQRGHQCLLGEPFAELGQ